MKKKNISKKVLAVLLSFVMIAVSIPFAIIGNAAGDYDPAPYFSETAIEEGARAWLDDEGNVKVAFPAATAQPTYKGEPLSIAFYILELVDMGAKSAEHTNTVIDTIKVTGTEGTFAAADVGTIDLANNRYSVTVTAVDTENWFSQPIYTTVTDVPVAELDTDRFANFSTSSTAVREIMTFESGTDDGTVTGSQLLYMGTAAEAGVNDLSDNVGDTSALRFIMNDQPTGTQIFDTSYSRQTWDFKGAEEIWYWMDLTNVELTGLSFRLRTNEKLFVEWKDGTIDTVQRAGETIYSTKGTAASTYTGEDPYIYVQREDGGWNKVMLKDDGTVDLGNFKGYVRVPLDFICSETDTYVDISNQEFGQSKSFVDWKGAINTSDALAWLSGMTFSSKVLVDNAGTSISDALLIHRRAYKTSSGAFSQYKNTFYWNINGATHLGENISSYDYSKIGYMLGMPLDPQKAKTSVTTGNASTDRAYIANGAVQNRDGGLTALEDIYNAGFSIEGCSADSLQHSFFVDNIFFYRSDGGAYTENTLDGNVNTGNPMSTYYNEELEISRIIFDEIDKYISDPDWADYREIDYILDLIEEYRAVYEAQGKSTAFLDLSKNDADDGNVGVGLAAAAATLGRDSWAVAWKAYEDCLAEGTLNKANADKDDLVPNIINTMEKLPAPENITSASGALRTEIVKLWKAYSLLNLGQLEMLGETEEKTLLAYFALVEDLEALDGDEFVVGQQLADYPYIVYNDFENQELGTKAWQLEDNKDAYTTGVKGGTSNLANDWRHLKGLVTYTTNGSTNITDKDYYGYVTTDSDKSQEALDGKVNYNASWATITNNGYMNSNAATMEIDSSFTADNNEGSFHTITLTRHGKDSATYTEAEANNMGLDGLGNFSTENVTGTTKIGLSLIFYVDFTELSSFYFTTNVFTKDADGNYIKARVNMGVALNDQTKIDDWKYFILNPDTGEWVINHTTSQWCFTSTKTDESWGDTMSLDGYKGYIMIPLYHIKVWQSATSDKKLDGNATWLNNIYAIQFCIGGANGNSLDEKSFTIDNVGFTYDPAGYASSTTPSYAEIFEAKSLPALNFEAAVEAIDPYDEMSITTAVQEAQALYDALPAYQKTVVADAKATLDVYASYAADISTIPKPEFITTDMAALIEALPDAAKNASVTGDYDLVHPGFTNGEVNYSAYGLTAETAAEIIRYYENSYRYYSVAEKASIDSTSLLNAYNAAMRCATSLESVKTDAVAFLPKLAALYERKTDADGNFLGYFVSIAGREEVQSFFDTEYHPLQYYSKTSIDDGSIHTQLTNTSRGFTYFLKNTQTYTFGEGENAETVNGGILSFRDKMQSIYDMAKGHIDNKELFTDEEIQSIKDIIEEYNALLPAYYNIEELYELEQAILGLFPTASAEALDVTEVLLTEDKLTGDASTYKVTYSEILDYDGGGDYYFVRVASKNGAMTNDYGNSVAYKIAINSDETTSADIVAASPYTATVTNNAYTPASPMSYVITPSLSSKPTGLSGTVRDTLTVELVLMEDGAETVIETQSIEVSYSMGDAYTVTIPAEFPVDWGDSTAQDVSYSVTTEMVVTSKITVGVTNDGTGTLTNSVTSDTLAYTVNDEFAATTDFAGSVTDAGPDTAPEITVSGWDDVPVGEYRTTLTYTVVYDDGTT